MELPTDQGSDQTDEPVTWIDYLNIGVSLILGGLLLYMGFDTLRMVTGARGNPQGGPGTPVPAPQHDTPETGNTTNGRVHVVKDESRERAS